jgi:transposase-like protein
MGLSRRAFTKEFKLTVVQRLESGSTVREVVRETGVNPGMLRRWRREVQQQLVIAFRDPEKRRWAGIQVVDMEREISRRILELDFLKACLRRFDDQPDRGWEFAVCQRILEEVQAKRGLTIDRMVQLGRVSRSRLYRYNNSESDRAVDVGFFAPRDTG